MTPINYEEFIAETELHSEITQDELLKKIIYQSVCYFIQAAELRFL